MAIASTQVSAQTNSPYPTIPYNKIQTTDFIPLQGTRFTLPVFVNLPIIAQYVAANWSGVPLAVANGGTGTSTPSLISGNNITITGTWPNQTINASGGSGSGAPGGSNGQLQYNSFSSFGGFTMGGDCSITVPNIVCTSTNGTAFSSLATLVPATGVATALGNTPNAAGGFTTYSGALGTPTSVNLTNATALPTTALTGTLQTSQVPAFTGDMTNTAGSLSTSVNKIGGQSVALGGSFTTSGANALTFTTTGATNVTLPTSGTVTAQGNTVTGFGSLVKNTSPTLITPNLGQPTAIDLNYGTNLPLGTGVSGNLPVTNLNSGTNASNLTFWRGDGIWAAPSVGAAGTSGQIQYNNAGTLAGFTVSGDGTLNTSTGVLSVTKTGGVAFGSLATVTAGTGVSTALGVNVGSAGSFVVNGGALGTPSSGTLTNATGLPLTTGVTGTLGAANGGTGITSLGTGVATALGNATGGTGGFTTFSGAFGTPSSITLTNATGLPISTGVSGLGTGVSGALGTNVGSAGAFVTNGGALGTPSSGVLTNATGLPLSTGVTGTLGTNNGGTGGTSFTANLPLIGNGAGALAQGSRSGSTTTFATSSGVLTNGHCVSIDVNGNFVDAGGSCTTGGGGGTVNSGTAGQLAYYPSTGTAVSGTNAGTGVVTALGLPVNGSGGISLTTGPAFSSSTITDFQLWTPLATQPTWAQGLVWYDQTNDVLDFLNGTSGQQNDVHLGTEVQMRVYNNTGTSIPMGSAVYINGQHSQFPTVALAKADAVATSSVVGLTNTAIANNTYGFVVVLGKFTGVNTSGFVDGGAVYLSDTTAGAITQTPPVVPSQQVIMGYSTYSNPSNGVVELIMPLPSPLSLNVASGSLTTSMPILNSTQTWNAVGTTFTGIKENITDTASASGSLLMDLQVGGISKFNVTKAGALTLGTALTSGNGGTGLTSFTSGGAMYATSTSALTTGTLPPSAGGTGITSLGTGVATALGNTTGATGGLTIFSGAFGTPSSITLTNATGLPVSTGISGFGTGVATALGTNVGSAGSFVVNGGALGTPSSGTLTNATGLPLTTGVSGTLGTGNGGTGSSATPSNGQILIGNGTTYTAANITAGTGINITNSAGGITISSTYTRTTFTATAGQTTFTVSYPVGLVLVFANGTLLSGSDYTASSGTSIVLSTARNAGDIIEMIVF